MLCTYTFTCQFPPDIPAAFALKTVGSHGFPCNWTTGERDPGRAWKLRSWKKRNLQIFSPQRTEEILFFDLKWWDQGLGHAARAIVRTSRWLSQEWFLLGVSKVWIDYIDSIDYVYIYICYQYSFHRILSKVVLLKFCSLHFYSLARHVVRSAERDGADYDCSEICWNEGQRRGGHVETLVVYRYKRL